MLRGICVNGFSFASLVLDVSSGFWGWQQAVACSFVHSSWLTSGEFIIGGVTEIIP